MNFRIYCKTDAVLTVNGKSTTYQKGKLYGFVDIPKKEARDIRKLAIKAKDIIFTETDDMSGCLNVTYGYKSAKEKEMNNLISMNKGKKNKKVKKEVKPEESKEAAKTEDIVEENVETESTEPEISE